jgi:phage N-6-adenine-methyltransferase
MKTEVMFSKASDEWETPQAFFDVLNLEFHFDVDAAATESNSKCGEAWFGLDDDAMCQDALLITHWGLPFNPFVVWLNPPYSKCREFIAKARMVGKSVRAPWKRGNRGGDAPRSTCDGICLTSSTA